MSTSTVRLSAPGSPLWSSSPQAQGAVAQEPERAAQHLVDRGDLQYTSRILREMPYDIWREFDHLDGVRFYALRLRQAGLIQSTPEQVIERGSDFGYIANLKRELQPT